MLRVTVGQRRRYGCAILFEGTGRYGAFPYTFLPHGAGGGGGMDGGRRGRAIATVRPVSRVTHSSSQSQAHPRRVWKVTLDSGSVSSLTAYFKTQDTGYRKWEAIR